MSSAHSSTFPSLHLHHNSFSNLSVTSSTSQLILQPFRRFTYVTAHSPTLPLLHLRHSSFSNPSFASPMSQALHLIHLASRPCVSFHPMGPSSILVRVNFLVEVFLNRMTFPSLHLRHNSFSNSPVALRTSQLILQPFRCFTYVSSFSNPSLSSPTSQALHLRHLASRPCVFSHPVGPSSIPVRVNFLVEVFLNRITFPSLHLRHNSFSNSPVALRTSQLIFQPFRCFTYVTAHSPTLLSLLLRHRLFTYVSWYAAHAKHSKVLIKRTF